MPRAIDFTGQRFGKLVVLRRGPNAGHHPRWECECDCGNRSLVTSDAIREGRSRSCGCAVRTRGGKSKTREYVVWSKMIARCHRPENDNYRFYGATGRFVCPRWRGSFEAFLEDMGEAPGPEYSLDRIDTDGSYTCGKCEDCREHNRPANCRWATKAEQSRNAKNNRWYTHGGRTMILKDWAREFGIAYLTLYNRIARGWDFDRAITTPARRLTKNAQDGTAVRGATASSGNLRCP